MNLPISVQIIKKIYDSCKLFIRTISECIIAISYLKHASKIWVNHISKRCQPYWTQALFTVTAQAVFTVKCSHIYFIKLRKTMSINLTRGCQVRLPVNSTFCLIDFRLNGFSFYLIGFRPFTNNHSIPTREVKLI